VPVASRERAGRGNYIIAPAAHRTIPRSLVMTKRLEKIREHFAISTQRGVFIETMAVTAPTRCSRLALPRRHGCSAQRNGLPILTFLLAITLFLAAQTPVLGQSWPQISFANPISGLTHPTHLTSARDGSGRLFVVEQPGRIRIIRNGALVATPFLDITARLGTVLGSRGLLSVAFPPDYASSQHFYVNYVVPPVGCEVGCGGNLVIARYHVTADPDIADANSEEIVLNEGPFPEHWGGELAFGPLDGYLYFGLGSGPPGDSNVAQDLSVLPGKIMRIDVETGDPATYTIPPSNPYVGNPNARPEIWALGVRNPWSSSFDRQTGDYYIADVGSATREEVDFESAGSAGGANYGWNIMEGSLCFDPPTNCDTTGLTLPVFEYDHSLGCDISGGTVYRAARYPSFYGIYFFGDWCSGRLWGLEQVNGSWQSALLFDTTLSIIGFSEDESGQLWVSDYTGGAIYPIVEGPPTPVNLSITQTESADPSPVANQLTYTLHITNNSSAVATGVVVSDNWTTAAAFVSVTSDQGTCSRSGNAVTCRIPSLPAGAMATVTLVLQPGAPGTIVNSATVNANEPDSDPTDDSATEQTTINGIVQITIQTTPTGRAFTVDGVSYNGTQTFSWDSGSSHAIATTSPQSGGTGVQYLWTRWSDNGAISHTVVVPTTNKIYTATFRTQYYLTMTHGAGGTVTPASGWKNSGAIVSIHATPTNNNQVSYNFSGWTGSGAGSYSGANNPASITMNGPITENGSFTQNNVQVTVQTSPAGLSFSVDGTPYTTAQTFSWQPGSSHTIATTSPQNGATGVRYVWSSWIGGGAISHTVAPITNKTYTANFNTQYFLTMSHGTGGTVTPASTWKASGAAVSIHATPASGHNFTTWSGSGTGSYSGTNNPASITMGGPITETASFSP